MDSYCTGSIIEQIKTDPVCVFRAWEESWEKKQFNKKGEPITHVVPVASIDSAIRCFPHVPSKQLFDNSAPGITHLLPRNHWSYMWMAVNDCLRESNSVDKVARRKGKLISMCCGHWLESVRVRYEKYLNATCADDLSDTV